MIGCAGTTPCGGSTRGGLPGRGEWLIRGGHVMTMERTSWFLDAGIPLGLSVDTTTLSGNADMFGIMKGTQSAENARQTGVE